MPAVRAYHHPSGMTSGLARSAASSLATRSACPVEHVATLHLRELFGNGLLQLGEEALAAEATHTRLSMVLAAGSGSADQFIG